MTDSNETQWLDQAERAAWIGLMAVLTRVPAALDRQLRTAAGMTQFDYQIMVILSETPGRTLRMSQIADWTDGSLPRLSQAAARLENAGWLERAPDPEDRRSTLATLTDDGFAALAAAAPGHVNEVRRLVFDSLTRTQVHQLSQITDRILRAPAIGPDPRPDNAR